ncbi:ral guanine nucleotide dissociation stimulator-like 1 [Athene cunicularia]|uniref:ral guanine nucleotide dissociation stimulator-like 1 n=1 Tax=Athene cunicularia TaxID=194338 RepID=UPI000EF6D478|nr:ral guanine nucleotide dissociation stimulator-like 1 [Athene cunicularia]
MTSEDINMDKSTILDVGEEVEEGAIFHVTLKRVEVQQAAKEGANWLGAEGDELPPEHTVSQYETCKIRTIKAGTLEKLVENLLTAFGDNDFTYTSIFLSTYRAFASTKEVLEILDRCGNAEPSGCEEDVSQDSSESKPVLGTAIASILGAWLDQCSEDFREPPDYSCLMKLLDYLKKNIPGSDLEKRAQNLLEKFQNQEVEKDDGFRVASLCNLCDEEEMDISRPEEFSFFQADLVAEQLTYMDAELFKKVVPYHCLGCIWSRRNKKEYKHLALTIRATISQFNVVTKCVVSTILKDKELKSQQRAKIIEKWINIAHVRHLFEGTSKFANLDSSVKENQESTQRRLQLQKDMAVMQGTVPFLGTFLTDLIMLDSALQDYIEGGLINFEKRRRAGSLIAALSLQLMSQGKTPAVLQRARLKHNLESDAAEDYELVQVISEDKELVIPDHANVFYAMNSHANFDFVLRKKASVSGQRKVRSRCSVTLPRTARAGCESNRLSKIRL